MNKADAIWSKLEMHSGFHIATLLKRPTWTMNNDQKPFTFNI